MEKAQIAMGRAAVAAGLNTALDTAAGGFSTENVWGAAEVAGAVAASDWASREVILPDHKHAGAARTVAQLAVEPLLAGAIAAGVEAARGNEFSPLLVAQVAAVDLAAGFVAPMLGVGVTGTGGLEGGAFI